MDTVTHTQMLAFHAELYSALLKAMSERGQRPEVVDGQHGVEPGWVVHERAVLHRLVNERCNQIGRLGVTAEAVYEVEQGASGHVDYATKYALRLAQLVYT